MDKLHGLLYPTCYLRQDTMLRLAQVFSKLTLLIPTEDTQKISPYHPSSNCPMEIEAIAPAPLGERLEWFTGLINNWESWAKQMGLGQKIPASTLMSAAAGKEREESIQTILNTLKKSTEATDPFLNAQIFLQLALDLDRQEDELHTDLGKLAVQEDRLKLILQGPGKLTDSPRPIEYSPMIVPLVMAKERLKAWTMLWQKFTDKRLWPIGESIALKDLIDSAYGTLQPSAFPIDLLELALPLDPNIRSEESDEISNMLTVLVDAIPNATIHDMNKDEKIQELAREIEEKWEEATKDQITGPKLTLTLYPQETWSEVLSKATNLNLGNDQVDPLTTNGWSFFLC